MTTPVVLAPKNPQPAKLSSFLLLFSQCRVALNTALPNRFEIGDPESARSALPDLVTDMAMAGGLPVVGEVEVFEQGEGLPQLSSEQSESSGGGACVRHYVANQLNLLFPKAMGPGWRPEIYAFLPQGALIRLTELVKEITIAQFHAAEQKILTLR